MLCRKERLERELLLLSHPLYDSESNKSDESDERAEEDTYERHVYNRIRKDDDLITSGYSTISSGKEEAYLNRHLINAAAAKNTTKSNQIASFKP